MDRGITHLQRISRALTAVGGKARGTDWWAVFVELAIVVLGILIAFELTNWSERRERRASELQLLQRIDEEARGDFDQLKNARNQHLQSVANFRRLANAIGGGGGGAESRARPDADCNLLRLPAVIRQSSSAGGLAAGERLELVSDPELRRRLREADAYRQFSDSQLVFFREAFQRYSAAIEPYMPWHFAAAGKFECRVDVDRLRGDPAALALLPKLARDQQQFATYRTNELKATKAVIERVGCLRRGSCG